MVKVKTEDGKERFILLKYYKQYYDPDTGRLWVIFPHGLKGMVFYDNLAEWVKARTTTEEPFNIVKWVEGND